MIEDGFMKALFTKEREGSRDSPRDSEAPPGSRGGSGRGSITTVLDLQEQSQGRVPTQQDRPW